MNLFNRLNNVNNYKELIENSVKKYNSNIAFLLTEQGKEKKITYYQFFEDIKTVINIFDKYQIKKQKVALISENRYEWCVIYFATVLSQNIIIPLDKGLTKEELENLLIKSKAKIIFFSKKQEVKLLEITTKVKTEIKHYINFDKTQFPRLVQSYTYLINKGKQLLNYSQEKICNIDSKNTSIILYTSGTTGEPKGVMLSQYNICSNIMGIIKQVKIKQKNKLISILPLHHTYECTLGLILPIYCGATIYFSKGYKYLYKEIEEYKPTIMMGVPLIYEKLYKRLSQTNPKKDGNAKKILRAPIRMLFSGAAPLDSKLIHELQKYKLKIYQVYGLTENSPVISIEGKKHRKIGSVGKVIPNIKYKIVKENEKGIGEIVIKGPSIMVGYENSEKQTKEAIQDGWLYTGDLGYFDSKGYAYIVGRKKNVIVAKNGENIYPEELETKLNQISYVKESIVYEDNGQICAKIILEKEYRGKKNIEQKTKQKINTINEKMQAYKKIKKVIITNKELKRTSTNKIKRGVKI